MTYVLDCSVTLAWLFEDESTPYTDRALEKLKESKAIVPAIWSLEVSNVILLSQRKGRITSSKAASFIDALESLPILVDDTSSRRALHSVFTLAETYHLTIYDASYLELALRENIPLLSLDKDLIKAAHRANLKTECSVK